MTLSKIENVKFSKEKKKANSDIKKLFNSKEDSKYNYEQKKIKDQEHALHQSQLLELYKLKLMEKCKYTEYTLNSLNEDILYDLIEIINNSETYGEFSSQVCNLASILNNKKQEILSLKNENNESENLDTNWKVFFCSDLNTLYEIVRTQVVKGIEKHSVYSRIINILFDFKITIWNPAINRYNHYISECLLNRSKTIEDKLEDYENLPDLYSDEKYLDFIMNKKYKNEQSK